MTASRSYAPLTALTLLTLVSILPGECALEPSVLDERHYTSGRSERHQKTSPTLPYGAPIPDSYGPSTTSGSAGSTTDVSKKTTDASTDPSAAATSSTTTPSATVTPNTSVKTETTGAVGSGASTGSSTNQTNTTGSTSAGAEIITPTPAQQKGITTGRRGRQGSSLTLPEEIGRVEGSRDMNIFQIEPTVIDERFYTSGKSERHQHISTTLPLGAPIPDRYTDAELKKEGVTSVHAQPVDATQPVNATPVVKPTTAPNTK